jgi:hypothetical protein
MLSNWACQIKLFTVALKSRLLAFNNAEKSVIETTKKQYIKNAFSFLNIEKVNKRILHLWACEPNGVRCTPSSEVKKRTTPTDIHKNSTAAGVKSLPAADRPHLGRNE